MSKERFIRPRKDDDRSQFRINEQIRIPEIRLVGDHLEKLSELLGETVEPGVYSTDLVRRWAQRMELDVVEISPNAIPPVCKIIDYNKFLYLKKKKEKEIKAKTVKTVVKEIRFGPNTDDHDFEFKTKHARAFLEDGAKVRAYVQFRGRSIMFNDRGELLLLKFLKELEDVGAAEALPKLEGKKMFVIVQPRKSSKKSANRVEETEE
ncbi:MAG: translation initiation factor IF-3 [Saprospiraceae bacterium]